jgi:hypothetical protein
MELVHFAGSVTGALGLADLILVSDASQKELDGMECPALRS